MFKGKYLFLHLPVLGYLHSLLWGSFSFPLTSVPATVQSDVVLHVHQHRDGQHVHQHVVLHTDADEKVEPVEEAQHLVVLAVVGLVVSWIVLDGLDFGEVGLDWIGRF